MKTDLLPPARGLVIAAVAVVTAIVAALALVQFWPGTGDRQAVVAERGAKVMPFDLDATTHQFAPTDRGGVQTVTADNPSDHEQIDLIRGHLRAEADAFARGDFDDPGEIHGEDMPGLAALRASAGRIDVEYADTDSGARISYTTDDPDLVTALHDWFAAQSSDHGSHAG